jgi:hypothetical protein
VAKTITAGTLAQSVEQRTENPCVPGSIPGGTTSQKTKPRNCGVLFLGMLKCAFGGQHDDWFLEIRR